MLRRTTSTTTTKSTTQDGSVVTKIRRVISFSPLPIVPSTEDAPPLPLQAASIPERPLPSILKKQSSSIRLLFDECLSIATRMSHGFTSDMRESAQDLSNTFSQASNLWKLHSATQQTVIIPAVSQLSPDVALATSDEWERAEALLDAVGADVDVKTRRIINGDAKYPRGQDFKDFVERLRSFVVAQRVRNVGRQESDLVKVLASLSDEEESVLCEKVEGSRSLA